MHGVRRFRITGSAVGARAAFSRLDKPQAGLTCVASSIAPESVVQGLLIPVEESASDWDAN
jgi:hypothetical protein